jgi:ankyrin repeat protein
MAVAALMGGGLAFAAPASAQFSDGYKLLEAVKKLDGTKVTDMLSDPSISVNTRDITTGETALHIVVQKRSNVWIQFLTQKGANPNIADVRGVTPLMVATSLGFTEGVSSLIAAGARVDTPNETGETPLITAVHRKDLALVRVLLKAGANPDRSDNSGRSARDYAAMDGRTNPVLTELEAASKAKAAGSAKVFGPAVP